MKSYLIFSAFFIPHLGGVERYTYNLARALIRKGNKVTVVTSNIPESSDYENIDGIDVYRLPCVNLLNGRFPLLKPNSKFRTLINNLSQSKFDFGIVQTRFYIHSLFGAYYLKKHKIPSIVIEHGTNHFTVNNRAFDIVGELYEHISTTLLKCFCRDFYGVSIDCTKWSGHFGIKSKGVLYNAVDLEDIQKKLEQPITDYREKYNLHDRNIICYAGRLVREKGILKLIEAVNKLNTTGHKITLLIAGDGDLYEEIQSTQNEHIILLGKLDFSQVVALYKSSDIFSLPTDYPEGFPTSVLEAAASRCYIITTTNGGSKELLINDDYGTVLQDNTADNIAAAIHKAVSDDTYRNRATELTYTALSQSFTWDTVSEKIISIQGVMSHD